MSQTNLIDNTLGHQMHNYYSQEADTNELQATLEQIYDDDGIVLESDSSVSVSEGGDTACDLPTPFGRAKSESSAESRATYNPEKPMKLLDLPRQRRSSTLSLVPDTPSKNEKLSRVSPQFPHICGRLWKQS